MPGLTATVEYIADSLEGRLEASEIRKKTAFSSCFCSPVLLCISVINVTGRDFPKKKTMKMFPDYFEQLFSSQVDFFYHGIIPILTKF